MNEYSYAMMTLAASCIAVMVIAAVMAYRMGCSAGKSKERRDAARDRMGDALRASELLKRPASAPRSRARSVGNAAALRIKCGLTQRELGELAGLNYWDISRYERGHTIPPRRKAKKIADALSVALGETVTVKHLFPATRSRSKRAGVPQVRPSAGVVTESRKLRLEAGMILAELSKATGIAESELSKFERYKQIPNANHASAIASALSRALGRELMPYDVFPSHFKKRTPVQASINGTSQVQSVR